MCQNRIRGLLKPQPLIYFAYAAKLFSSSLSSNTTICTVWACVHVCDACIIFLNCLLFDVSSGLSVLDREKNGGTVPQVVFVVM